MLIKKCGLKLLIRIGQCQQDDDSRQCPCVNNLSVFGVYCPYKASRRLCHHRVRVSVHRVCIFRQRCPVALRAKLFFLLYFFLLLFQLPKAQRTKSIRKMQQVKKTNQSWDLRYSSFRQHIRIQTGR